MAILDMNSETLDDDGPSEEQMRKSREERKRTGRFVAAGTAIFLSLLGIYQAILNGTPQYAALFAPAVIMIIYVLWILHASRNQTARLLKISQSAVGASGVSMLVGVCLLLQKNRRLKAAMAAKSEETENGNCENLTEKNYNEKNTNNENNKDHPEETTILLKEQGPEKPIPTKGEKEYYNRSYSIA